MSLSLESLGINIYNSPKNNFQEDIIKYCLDKINGENLNTSPQLILAHQHKLNQEIIKLINTNLERNLLNKRQYIFNKSTLSNFEDILNDFLLNYINQLKSIDVILGLSYKQLSQLPKNTQESEQEQELEEQPTHKLKDQHILKFNGNFDFVQKNIEVLCELIIFNPVIKKFLLKFILKNINTNSNKKNPLMKTLQKIDNYNLEIFSEFIQYIIKWFNKTVVIPEEYPLYLKEVYELETLITRCNKIKIYIQNNFPFNRHSHVYIPILNCVIVKKFGNLKIYNQNGFIIINKFLTKVLKLTELVPPDTNNYYKIVIENKIEDIFSKITELTNIPIIFKLYQTFHFIQPEIGSLFKRCVNSNIFKNILNTIINLSEENLITFVNIINNYLSTSPILIRLKFQLSNVLWELTDDEINKINIFIKNTVYHKKEDYLNIISSMLEDIIQTKQINMLILPHQAFHFSRGLWDFPMDKNYFSEKHFNTLPFGEELNALFINQNDIRKELIVFSTKGSVILELQDQNGTLIGTFLPIQAMIIKVLLEEDNVSVKVINNICTKTGIEQTQKTKIFNTLADLIVINNTEQTISLKETLPYYNKKNFAELFFIETTLVENKITYDIILSFNEYIKSNVCSILKQQPNMTMSIIELEQILKKSIKKYHTFDHNEFTKIINSMIKYDYIYKENDYLIYIIY
ncbi:hypothetical protein crov297 [Cafeteria roenbergensis virus]|uniref:Cullin family profile domain-containing protein n=1 Tax=Cafeteria roenbergensis virus (strain BV-PW1) TaxID=693272 RepID=E3T567_CROVB|nr:hypothetical protein crov297 [Cafeteria roenbergensis virus BV-PW1]ADO67330.1 hypothetical protein crov297 [Cafeteria roenbergensis virus BV-PW1]